jgi:hypothetical protein
MNVACEEQEKAQQARANRQCVEYEEFATNLSGELQAATLSCKTVRNEVECLKAALRP